MVPLRLRRAENDVAYCAVRSLSRDSSRKLISRLLKDASITADAGELGQLIDLGDGHPFNIYRMVDEIRERGIKGFLANPSDFINWKHRQSSEYLAKVKLSDRESSILALLKLVPELDFDTLVAAIAANAAELSDDLLRLTGLHVLESTADRFTVSPPLRVAVERDKRVRLPDDKQREALRIISESLSVRLEEGTASVALVNSAVLASLETGGAMTAIAAALLLPSHYVWLAKAQYDRRNWSESIRLAREALKSRERLSHGGFVAACRFLCLSAARLGEEDVFQEGIRRLEADAKDDWAKSNVAFLKGFNLRLRGSLPAAEAEFREAYRLSPGNISAAREIAAISLVRGNLDEAERFAREAYGQAGNNPYVVDILITVLLRKHGKRSRTVSEILDMLGILEKIGEEGGRSFFTSRKAEFELVCGRTAEARKFVERAIARTPRIFEPHRIYVEVLLKEGNKTKARDELNIMREIVNSRDPNERRTNYRSYLEMESAYLTEIGQYAEAKRIFNDQQIFTDDERSAAIKRVEIAQSYSRNK
jgi:tetratricopeptide (TPR) repeat protein